MIWLIVFAVAALPLVLYRTVKHARTQTTVLATDSVNRSFYKHVLGINQKNPDGKSRQDVINDCHKGEELVLLPDLGNPHDSGVVRVSRKNGEQLGYLPEDRNRMAHELNTGWTFRATVDDIYPFEETSRKHGIRSRFDVLTHGQDSESRRKTHWNSH